MGPVTDSWSCHLQSKRVYKSTSPPMLVDGVVYPTIARRASPEVTENHIDSMGD